ncbi:MAG: hypothetical protein VCB43_13835, partial [Myxococcota bacterium]
CALPISLSKDTNDVCAFAATATHRAATNHKDPVRTRRLLARNSNAFFFTISESSLLAAFDP